MCISMACRTFFKVINIANRFLRGFFQAKYTYQTYISEGARKHYFPTILGLYSRLGPESLEIW